MTNFSGNKYARHIEDGAELRKSTTILAHLHEARVANLIALAKEQRESGNRIKAVDSMYEAERMMGFKKS